MYNQKEMEGKILERWNNINLVKKIKARAKKKKKFFLLDGPPYVNGVPHVGHAKTTIFKDIWGKFKFMQGFDVWLQPGFDCGGLPIENKVEKELGIKSKSEIEDKIGVDKFIEACQKFAKGNVSVWLNFYKKLAAWRGWFDPYLTSENYYLESGWWTIKKWFEKGLFVEGYRPGFWCPHCETVLAGIETNESYKNVEDPSIIVKFRVPGTKEFLLVFTTTPWTLPANAAVAVHPDETYVKAESDGEILIIAEKRLEELKKIGKYYKIAGKFSGKKLAGIKYEPLFDTDSQKEIAKNGNAHRVILSVPVMKKRVASKAALKGEAESEEEFGHIVTMDVGTGLVHIAPGHGDVDNRIGKHYNLPEISPVDEKGRLTADVGKYAGMFVKKADAVIIEDLNSEGKLLHAGRLVHSYPLCWRCKTPLIYRMSRQWFLKLDTIRDKIIKANKEAVWMPEFARERYHAVITAAPDWAVTRQRYWGIPLPIWSCPKCGSKKVIGSSEELRQAATKKLPKNFDLRKNFVDKVRIRCECGGEMEREKDVMDVWFDSGIAPWASLGYPLYNKEIFEGLWNVDLVDESQDQIRAWFHYLMMCSFATFDAAPFRVACLNGWTLDDKGEKMSKSLGNVILGEEAHKKLGADLLRLYIVNDVAPWETQKFSFRQAEDLGRQLSILWNTYIFYKTYSESSNYRGEKAKKLEMEDQWIISRVNSLAQDVTNSLERFEFHLAGRFIANFVLEDLSRWYVKIIKDRTWPTYSGRDKNSALFALRYSLGVLSKLLAPICPFIAEELYLGLNKKEESVHLSEWFYSDKKLIRKDLESYMEIAKKVVEASNSLRHEKGVKLKYPLNSVLVKGDKKFIKAVKSTESVIGRLANVKGVKEQKISKESSKEVEGGLVSLDFKASEELKKEWLLRELIRSIQEKRKEMGLNVKDKIVVYIPSAFKSFEKTIKEETCSKVVLGAKGERLSFEFEGKKYEFGVEK